MIEFINSIVRYYKTQGKNYDFIDRDSLLFFEGTNGEYMYEILNARVVIHDWFNREGVRRN